MVEVVDCEEFDQIEVRVSKLLDNGELRLDDRIATKGYLTASMAGGQVVLRATRFVGLIPLTSGFSVRVKPRTTIFNLSYMLARSGVAPSAIAGFARGYMPRFVATDDVERIYGRALVEAAQEVVRRGLVKDYVRPAVQTPWRGRLLVSETVRRHAAKGIRYRHEFEQTVLSPSIVENVAVKAALVRVAAWLHQHDRKSPLARSAQAAVKSFDAVASWDGPSSDLVVALERRIRTLPAQRSYYLDALWTAFPILQGALPEIGVDGFVRLDSLIIDVSKVFEAFVRRELAARLHAHGFAVIDGNKAPTSFFKDAGPYAVHPDMVLMRDGKAVAVLDAKYKPDPKESDRYEVLSFMDAVGVSLGGFVCPSHPGEVSRFLGTTATEKRMVSLRFDLAAEDPIAEADRFAENVRRMLAGSHDFA